MLMLKFGRLVDLEKLENVTVNRTVEELKEKLRQQESKSAAEIAKWNVSSSSKLYVSRTSEVLEGGGSVNMAIEGMGEGQLFNISLLI